ncbi:uncharacterized protein LOC127585673 isoform X2 [Pristis pectinata]|uniref:uncharacterized protein LOC127585673 isoform X2 n=1 Tax=Pristis pectinata TaxID=685728 RepID=UPI00223E06C0|nr:uncharacterized protein LOC127585673 isoform X2 [Pristis pectinata]
MPELRPPTVPGEGERSGGGFCYSPTPGATHSGLSAFQPARLWDVGGNRSIGKKSTVTGRTRKLHTDSTGGDLSYMKMECPLCGHEFPITLIDYHAWQCNGHKVPNEGASTQEKAASSDQIQATNNQRAACTPDLWHSGEEGSAFSSETSVVPYSGTERSQEAEECPLCFCSFPADLILEHAAFCNGPSCSEPWRRGIYGYTEPREQGICGYTEPRERGICGYTEPREKAIPSCSQDQGRGVLSEVTSNIMQAFHSYIDGKDSVVPRAATCSVESGSRREENETSQNVQKIVTPSPKGQQAAGNSAVVGERLIQQRKPHRRYPIRPFLLPVKTIFAENLGSGIFGCFNEMVGSIYPRGGGSMDLQDGRLGSCTLCSWCSPSEWSAGGFHNATYEIQIK